MNKIKTICISLGKALFAGEGFRFGCSLVIRSGPGYFYCSWFVSGKKGWNLEELPEDADVPETVAIRESTITIYESKEIRFITL